jgi:phosphomannomutase
MTSIKFGTDGWRAVIAADFTFANLSRVTAGVIAWMAQQPRDPAETNPDKGPKVMVGYDCRFLGAEFATQVACQLAAAGLKVFLTPGFVSTPMVSLATLQRQCDLGIIITASHNPPQYSGFKLKGSYGGPAYPEMIAAIEALIPAAAPTADWPALETFLATRQVEFYDAEALYINYIREQIDLEAINRSRISTAYDAMYGAGQRVLPRLLPQTSLLHCDYNPSFNGQAPEPIARNLAPFQALIQQQGIDWGLATDGDADRIGLFDERGQFVDSHHLLLLLLYYLHEIQGQNGTVVVTFSVTEKMKLLCQRYGLPLQITPIGFKYIGQIMGAEKVLLGGEESGGIAVWGHIPERDGIYIGLVILQLMAQSGKKLTELVQEIYDRVGSFAVERLDLHLAPADKERIIAACRSGAYQQFGAYRVESMADLDGYKYYLNDGQWVMIRPSGTEPVLRIYAESVDSASAFAILHATCAALGCSPNA